MQIGLTKTKRRCCNAETLIVALISAGASLTVSMVTLITNTYIEKIKNKFPNLSPNDVLKWVEYPPNYSLEAFDAVIKILDYRIEDYKKQLGSTNIEYERENHINMQILNREYCKKKISEIRDNYFNARDKYISFYKSDKALFDLYAGQNVRNALVEFEVVIHNTFISGRNVGDADDPLNNSIELCRRNLINSMRNDIGIS